MAHLPHGKSRAVRDTQVGARAYAALEPASNSDRSWGMKRRKRRQARRAHDPPARSTVGIKRDTGGWHRDDDRDASRRRPAVKQGGRRDRELCTRVVRQVGMCTPASLAAAGPC